MAASALVGGCFSLGAYTTPRTLPRGRVQGYVALEAAALPQRVDVAPPPGSGESGAAYRREQLSAIAAGGGRVGLIDGIELGFRANSSGMLGADLKLRAVQSRFFDLAFDPAVYTFGGVGGVVGQLTVLAGINAGEHVQFVLGPRAGYAWLPDGTYHTDAAEPSPAGTNADGFGVGGVVGVRVGTRGFAVQPEYGVVVSVTQPEIVNHSFGVGFVFGAQPDYAPAPPSGVPAR